MRLAASRQAFAARERRLARRASQAVPASRSSVVVPTALSSNESRLNLLLALPAQAANALRAAVTEAAREFTPRLAADARSLQEAVMQTPAIETPPYAVARRTPTYELRDYESFDVAETAMGDAPVSFESSSRGFNTLASYLFGGNARAEKMSMTTPVISARGAGAGNWRMRFVMPKQDRTGPLPAPLPGSPVALRPVPARRLAVLAFPGNATESLARSKAAELRAALTQDGLELTDPGADFELSQYNPPFTPGPLRRNEVAYEVRP